LLVDIRYGKRVCVVNNSLVFVLFSGVWKSRSDFQTRRRVCRIVSAAYQYDDDSTRRVLLSSSSSSSYHITETALLIATSCNCNTCVILTIIEDIDDHFRLRRAFLHYCIPSSFSFCGDERSE
jgi:hypothetical protein